MDDFKVFAKDPAVIFSDRVPDFYGRIVGHESLEVYQRYLNDDQGISGRVRTRITDYDPASPRQGGIIPIVHRNRRP
jgi:hypothetical protein